MVIAMTIWEKYKELDFVISESVSGEEFEFILCQNPGISDAHILFVLCDNRLEECARLRLPAGCSASLKQTSSNMAFLVIGDVPAFVLQLDSGTINPIQ